MTSGKWLILFMSSAVIVAAIALYQTFSSSPRFKTLATAQMKEEFSNYSKTFLGTTEITLTGASGQSYSLPISTDWTFVLHQKTLLVTTASFIPIPTSPDKKDLHQKAKEQVQNLLFKWLQDKYHSQKDLLLQVQIP